MHVETMEDEKEIHGYLNKVHEMVSELYAKQHGDGVREKTESLRSTMLSEEARKGDKREVRSTDICRIGEIVLFGGMEARIVLAKASLIFRFPLEQDHPIGTVVRPLAAEEFLREEEGRWRLSRKGGYDDVHFVCYVDLLESHIPERADGHDEAPDRLYAEDLEERIQRMEAIKRHFFLTLDIPIREGLRVQSISMAGGRYGIIFLGKDSPASGQEAAGERG